MNITDPLENHRKNLYNFYLACNILGNSAKSNSNFTDDDYDDTNVHENESSKFLPFFQFDNTSVSQTTQKFCDNGNLTVDENGIDPTTTTSSIIKDSNCNELSQVEIDTRIEGSDFEKEFGSDFDNEHETTDEEESCYSRENIKDISEKIVSKSRKENEFNLRKSNTTEREKFSDSDNESNEKISDNETENLFKAEEVRKNYQKTKSDSEDLVENDSNLCNNENATNLKNNSVSMVPQTTQNIDDPTSFEFKTGSRKKLIELVPTNPHEEEITTFSCYHCKKSFRHKSSISRHSVKCLNSLRAKEEKKRLNGMRPKKWTKTAIDDKTCKICGHIARKPCELKLHLSKHTGERPFSCKECGISFASTSKLNRHIRNKVHAKGKFYCESCKIYFTVEANYERHKSDHLLPVVKMKPFACVMCSKRFSRLDILRKHVDVHSREEREVFECMACERKFSRKDTLSRHINRGKCRKENKDWYRGCKAKV